MKAIALLGAGLALLGLATGVMADPQALRIGYQKGSIALVLAKENGILEKRFAATRVQWIEFPAGPQMLEALNIGSLDVGSTGDIPPLFAQAAGADLVYIGAEPAKPSAEVILVREDSTRFLVSVGGDHFVIPLDMVTECMEERADALDASGHLNLRGRPLPSVDLARHFGLPGDPQARRNIVVVNQGRQQAGLIVEHLLGELQTVIKPLGQMFQHLSGISGSTILGSGQVALILDIPSLFRHLQQRAESEPRLAASPSMLSPFGESPCK